MSDSLIRKFGVSARAVRKVATVGCLYVVVPVQAEETGLPELKLPNELSAAYMGLSEIKVFSPGASQSNEGLNSMIGTIGCRSNDREQIGIQVVCHLFAVVSSAIPGPVKIYLAEVPSQDDYDRVAVVWAKIL